MNADVRRGVSVTTCRTVPQADYQALLRALPNGGQIWLRAGGQSLWPLLLDGDLLLIKRCDHESLTVGAIAVVTWADQPLVAHLVKQLEPLITWSSVGRHDAARPEVLGRVIALRRGSRRVELPSCTPHLLRWVPVSASVIKRLPGARRMVRLLRGSGRP